MSYIFYGWWDWRFLILIFFSSIVDFFVGQAIANTARKRNKKWLLAISLTTNLGLLGYFKYANFFIENFVQLLINLGLNPNLNSLNIILPVGISFYTFQTLSYSIDVYRGHIKPTKNLLAFLSFVSFFPQLVAGPIERASNLLPQFFKKIQFNYQQITNGLSQILYGFFLKLLVADHCAPIVNNIFDNHTQQSGLNLIIGVILFAFQIYGDFGGYSHIAIGCGKLLGFKLQNNFLYPYFSRDIAEFWRRWHISLSSWFKDYLYIPLGGNRGAKSKAIGNIFIIFLVSGFWHGANWTFIFWGGLHALYYLPLFVFRVNRKNENIVAFNKLLPNIAQVANMATTFLLVCLAWVFFRANSITHAFEYLNGIFNHDFHTMLSGTTLICFGWVGLLIWIDWLGRSYDFPFEFFLNKSRKLKYAFHLATLISILIFTNYHSKEEFIYFQF